MNTELPPTELFDLDKSPLGDADHDPERIADALRNSPHFLDAHGAPGGDTITVTTAAGIDVALILKDAEPTDDDILPEPVLIDAVAAAILNHPGFVVATPDSPREDTITVQTRGGIRYQLDLAFDRSVDPGAGETPTPAADVAYAADQILTSDPSESDRSVAELLNYVAATWGEQDLPLRQHAQAVARNLLRSR